MPHSSQALSLWTEESKKDWVKSNNHALFQLLTSPNPHNALLHPVLPQLQALLALLEPLLNPHKFPMVNKPFKFPIIQMQLTLWDKNVKLLPRTKKSSSEREVWENIKLLVRSVLRHSAANNTRVKLNKKAPETGPRFRPLPITMLLALAHLPVVA